MNDPAQAAAYAGADCSVAHDAFIDRFRGCFPAHQPKTVLDLGCGSADITLRFARAFPAARMIGIDAADAMLALARDLARSLGDSVGFVQTRLADYEPQTRFDTLISNSLLHHLADPLDLWRAVARCAAPNAVVFVMDLRRPPSTTAARDLVETYASSEAELFRRDFYASLLAAYEVEEIAAQLRAVPLSLQAEAVGDRHVMVWGRVV